MYYWHITIGIEGRLAAFNDETVLRACVRDLARLHGRHVVLFCFVDDHFHCVVALAVAGEAAANAVGRSIRLSLRYRLGVPVQKAYPKPVLDVSHLNRLVRYVLRQPFEHGVREATPLWSGSCILDIVGARLVPGLELQLQRALPRLRLVDVLEPARIPPDALVPASREMVERLGAARLAAAAAAATAASSTFEDRSTPTVRARLAAANLGARAGLPKDELARALRISVSGLRRLVRQGAPSSLERAVLLRLGLEEALAGRPPVSKPSHAA